MRIVGLFLLVALSARPCMMSYPERLWAKQPGAKSRLFAFERDGKTGFIDPTGKIVIPPTIPAEIRNVGDFANGLARVGYHGYVTESGVSLTPSPAGYIRDFHDGIATVMLPSAAGYAFIGTDGRQRFAMAADSAGDFSNGLAWFAQKPKPAIREFKPGRFTYRDFPGLRGYIDEKGAIVIPAQFAETGPFTGALARVVLDGYCHIARPDGDRQGTPTTGYPTSCGGAPEDAVQACPTGFINRAGKLAIPADFESARDFTEGLAAVRKGEKWGFIDESGAVVIAPRFQQAHAFREGFAAVLLNGKWGFVNRAGALVIPATLEEPGPFSEGLAVAGPPGKLYYIDTHGKTVLPGPYREATPFVHGLAAVRRGAREVEYIQKSGRAVFRYTTGGK